MKNLLDVKHRELFNFIIDNGYDHYRIIQVYEWIYKYRIYDFKQMTNLPKKLVNDLGNNYYISIEE